MRKRERFDAPVLVIGGLATAALGVGLATAFLYVSRSSEGPNVGPTAATLDEAFSTLFGAALGLAVGSGIAAGFTRRGSRLATGALAGFLAYVTVLVPIVVATRPSDVGFGESLETGLALALPLGLVVIVGSMAGAALGRTYKKLVDKRQGRTG